MKWVTNLWLLSKWKFCRLFRLQGQSIAPVQWREPLLTSYPDQSFCDILNEDQRKRLHAIVQETRTISMLTLHFPSEITSQNWLTLLDCQTRKQRLDYLKFLRSRELARDKDSKKKQKKIVAPPAERESDVGSPYYLPASKLEERSIAWQRVARAYRCGSPSLVVDCRFFPLLSPRGAELTALQLKYLISENRDERLEHLCGMDSPMTSSPVVSSHSFSSLFPRERILYLSPDAEEELTDVDEDHVYVLGGIVDRVVERNIPRQASLTTALSEQVTCKKLPLDRYVKWKSGTKFLTLTAVSSILRNVYSSGGNWEDALRRCVKVHIPVRNIRPPEEKSIVGRQLHDRIRQFDRQLLQILEREVGSESL
uniref:SAM-dependent MTase TRM10-type domain-containing protein n=1 Tax=Angiostrongylus cantonensis TaxID=6313 RepID=A0A0K0CV78_ANGCA